MSERWYVHTTEYYLALKPNQVPTHATAKINSEAVVLSEEGQK